MYKVRTNIYSPMKVPNSFEDDYLLETGEASFSPFKYKYSGLYWEEPYIPHYLRLVPRNAYQTYHYRKDPVPYTGCPRKRSERGIRYGRYAKEILSYQDVPVRDSLKSRYKIYIDPWGYYDSNYTQYYSQPKRDWKRTKVKRQFMKHKGYFGKTHKELSKEYLEEFPFDAKLLEKELFDSTSKRLLRYGGVNNFVPEDNSKYVVRSPDYVYKRDDGDYEYACPSCNYLNMTNYKWYDEPWSPVKCEYCDQFIKI